MTGTVASPRWGSRGGAFTLPSSLPRHPDRRRQLAPREAATILSVSSFHRRGFLPFPTLGGPVTTLAAIEPVFGLFIEAGFIATCIQRVFGK